MRYIFIASLLALFGFGINTTASSSTLVKDKILTIAALDAQDYEIADNAELHVTNPSPESTGIIDITSESGWLFLDGVLPTQAIATYFAKIRVNGQHAVLKNNIRVTNYLRGCVIMSHSTSYQPLTAYKDENYMGEELKLSQYTYHRKAQLGSFDDAISSFKLKRGYMATFAFNEDGTRFSKVYIADNEDINIPVLPVGLNNEISFIRVLPWRYAGKKGFGYSDIKASKVLTCDWYYSWGPISAADLTDFEFVPMKWNAKTVNDANWNDILLHQNVTHVLGFNEPDADKQANMTVDKQIEMWPKMLESGLRLGAPAFAGKYEQLYEFIDRCDALNYRVDFIPLHLYLETTPANFYKRIKEVYDRTKRPIWITEFNYGGDWTSGNPTHAQVRDRIAEIVQTFDTARIIERYAVFDFDNFEKSRNVFTEPTTNYVTTPMGSFYRDNIAPMAYRSTNDFFSPYRLIAPTSLTATLNGGKVVSLNWKNDGDTQSVTIERTLQGTTNYQVIATLTGNLGSYTDNVPNYSTYIYRIKTKNTSNETSPYGSILVDVKEFINVVLNKKAEANSTLSASYNAAKAVDGDTISDGSRWVNVRGAFPSYITVDLNGTYTINELKLYTGYQGYNTPITNFDFQYWDGTSWVNVVSETENTNARYSQKFTEVKTDSVRLYVNGVADTSPAGGIIRLFEMQVMGTQFINSAITNSRDDNQPIQVYPNPTTGILHLSNVTKIDKIEILDLQGRVVFKKSVENTIDLSSLFKGIYFLKTDKKQVVKIIKE